MATSPTTATQCLGSRRQGTGGRPARSDPQRRAGRPHRSRQDHAGRGPARRDRDDLPGRPGRGRHHGQRLRRGRGPAAALGLAVAGARSSTTASRSTCSTPPATPTSSATCGPGCAPPTPRCSSSPRSTASTARPGCSGRSAPRSACRAPSSSPSWTRRGPTSRRPSRSASASSATACCRSTCRCAADDGTAAGLIGLLSQQVFDYSRRHPRAARPGRRSTCR